MDFWRTVLVLFRRWYVVVPAFMVTIAATMAVYASVPARYESNAVLVLTTPLIGSSTSANPDMPPSLINPLLNFEQGLNTSAAILIQALQKPELAAQLGVVPGGDTSYEVNNGSINPELLITGPFLFIRGESGTASGAEGIVRRVVQRARIELANRQQVVEAPKPTYITMDVVVPATVPEEKRSGKARSAVAALGLGGIASLVTAFASESVANARRERRQPRVATGAV